MSEPRKVRQAGRSRSAVLRPDWNKIASDRKKFAELLALMRQIDEEKIKKMMAELSREEADQVIDTLAQGVAWARRELARRKRLRAIAEERRESKMEGKDA